MKFSIILPVYNVEKYLAKCLDSIFAQDFEDYEVIAVNDGSTDNSPGILEKYADKNKKLRVFSKENGGLSSARNYGIKQSNGDYLLFIDSDDYISPHLLRLLDKEINDFSPDVVGFGLTETDEKGEKNNLITRPVLHNATGGQAVTALVCSKTYFETAVCYCCKRQYWLSNGYSFKEGIYHEDFALMPLVILGAEKVSLLDFCGYYYVSRFDSIMQKGNAEKAEKKAHDLLTAFDLIKAGADNSDADANSKAALMSYSASALISRLNDYEGELKNNYKKELKNRKISSYLLDNTFKRKIRKILICLKYGL